MKKLYYLLVLLSIMFYGCEKTAVETPALEIYLDSMVYDVNKPVEFKFEGTADLVTFYSGKDGNEFQFRERVKVDGKPLLSFTSYRQPALPANTTENSLKVLVSTNFRGIYNAESIAMAKWTDVTAKAILSKGTDNTASGAIDLSGISTGDSLVYVAFKYEAPSATTAQPTWTIKNVLIDNQIQDNPVKKVNVRTLTNLTWNAVDILDVFTTTNKWSSSTTQLQILGGAANTVANEDWLISAPVDLRRVPRDAGTAVKTNPRQKLSSYVFGGYATPGAYNVTFEIINANRYDTKSTLKEFTITVK